MTQLTEEERLKHFKLYSTLIEKRQEFEKAKLDFRIYDDHLMQKYLPIIKEKVKGKRFWIEISEKEHEIEWGEV